MKYEDLSDDAKRRLAEIDEAAAGLDVVNCPVLRRILLASCALEKAHVIVSNGEPQGKKIHWIEGEGNVAFDFTTVCCDRIGNNLVFTCLPGYEKKGAIKKWFEENIKDTKADADFSGDLQ